jgi:hypothetical protein
MPHVDGDEAHRRRAAARDDHLLAALGGGDKLAEPRLCVVHVDEH